MTASDQQARDVLVALADTLVADFDIIDFLDVLTGHCVDLLGVTAAGVLLVDHRGTLNMVAASTERARVLELFQLQNDEGPCLDCYHSGEVVVCADISEAVGRWPLFARAAAEAGFAAVHALPMRLRDTVVGGLNLFSAQPGRLSTDVVGLGQALANVATVGILHQRTIRHSEIVVEQLQATLDSRILLEQAKGVLSERLQVTVGDAFLLLREYSRRGSRMLADVAADVVDGSADVSAIAAVAASDPTPTE
ncbi:GAF and ANTAR domain-containing protein [Lentzea alba]|uniref:GAF and ANTAR domain-containing protein n=1 Tax=Lentzea alba TaxID=2714351 RepID=UPI0039BF938C